MTQQTPYVETEALIAVMDGDEERAAALVRGMTVREMREFRVQLQALMRLLDWGRDADRPRS